MDTEMGTRRSDGRARPHLRILRAAVPLRGRIDWLLVQGDQAVGRDARAPARKIHRLPVPWMS